MVGSRPWFLQRSMSNHRGLCRITEDPRVSGDQLLVTKLGTVHDLLSLLTLFRKGDPLGSDLRDCTPGHEWNPFVLSSFCQPYTLRLQSHETDVILHTRPPPSPTPYVNPPLVLLHLLFVLVPTVRPPRPVWVL